MTLRIQVYIKYSDTDQQRAQVCMGVDVGIGIDDKSVVVTGVDTGAIVATDAGCTACAAGTRESRGNTTNATSAIIITTIIPYICGAKYIICDAKNKLYDLFFAFQYSTSMLTNTNFNIMQDIN